MRPPLRAVIFDYGHTLMGFEYIEERLLPAYERISGFLREELERPFPPGLDLIELISKPVEHAIKSDYETGRLEEMDISATYHEAFSRAGHPVPPELIEQVMEIEQLAWNEIVQLSPHTMAVLEWIHEQGLKVGICSNVAFLPRLMLAQMMHLQVHGHFDYIGLSSATGWRKPHAAFYQAVLDGLEITGPEAVYVGDRMREDVRGPAAFGMRTVLTHEFRQETPPGPGDPPDWHRPDAVINSLDELIPLVTDWLGTPAASAAEGRA